MFSLPLPDSQLGRKSDCEYKPIISQGHAGILLPYQAGQATRRLPRGRGFLSARLFVCGHGFPFAPVRSIVVIITQAVWCCSFSVLGQLTRIDVFDAEFASAR